MTKPRGASLRDDKDSREETEVITESSTEETAQISSENDRESLQQELAQTPPDTSLDVKAAMESLSDISKGDSSSYVERGSRGPGVQAAQDLLIDWALRQNLEEDTIDKLRQERATGEFNRVSQEILMKFQSSYGLDENGEIFNAVESKTPGLRVDGVLGIRTLNALAQEQLHHNAQEVLLSWVVETADEETRHKLQSEIIQGRFGEESKALTIKYQREAGIPEADLDSFVLDRQTFDSLQEKRDYYDLPPRKLSLEPFAYSKGWGNLGTFRALTGNSWGGQSDTVTGFGDSFDIEVDDSVDEVVERIPMAADSGHVSASPEEIQKYLSKRYGEDYTLEQTKNIIAGLGIISLAEGTANEYGYNTAFGYKFHADLSGGHPGISSDYRDTTTSAFGKYQFMDFTYDRLNEQGKMHNFMPKNQDFAAIELIRDRGVLDELANGELRAAMPQLAYEWASLPVDDGGVGRYGQRSDQSLSLNQLEQAFSYYRANISEPVARSSTEQNSTTQSSGLSVLDGYKSYVASKGGKINYGKEDCVEFLVSMITDESGMGISLSDGDIEQLKIDYEDLKSNDAYRSAVEQRDSRIKGVAGLVQDKGLGSEVSLNDAQAGDLIQYHYVDEKGKQAGHAAIISEVTRDESGEISEVTLLGSHRQTGGTGAIKVSAASLSHSYIARIDA